MARSARVRAARLLFPASFAARRPWRRHASPFWISDNNGGVATLYDGHGRFNRGTAARDYPAPEWQPGRIGDRHRL